MAGFAKGKKLNRRRRGRLAVVLPWLRRFGLALAGLVFLGWAGAWFFWSEADEDTAAWIERETISASAAMGFAVENIIVEGRVHTDPEALRAIVNIGKGDPLFSLKPDEVRALVERLGWVKRAHVERRLPDTVYIRLEERRPLAFWENGGGTQLIDTDGEVIAGGDSRNFKGLAVIRGGEKAAREAPALLRDIGAEPILKERLAGAQHIGGRRWDLAFSGGVIVKLPGEDAGLALRRLAHIQEEEGILDKDIAAIDLRAPDRVVVRTRPGAVREYKAGLNAGSPI